MKLQSYPYTKISFSNYGVYSHVSSLRTPASDIMDENSSYEFSLWSLAIDATKADHERPFYGLLTFATRKAVFIIIIFR